MIIKISWINVCYKLKTVVYLNIYMKTFLNNLVVTSYLNEILEKLTLSNISKKNLTDIVLAWSRLTFKIVISNYHNEIILSNSNIRVGKNTIFFKERFWLGIKHINICMTQKTKDTTPLISCKFNNLPATDFLR